MFVCFYPKMISTTRKRDEVGFARSCPKAAFSVSFSGCWSSIESGPFPAVEPVSSSGGRTAGRCARWVARVAPSGTTQFSLARGSSVTKPSVNLVGRFHRQIHLTRAYLCQRTVAM